MAGQISDGRSQRLGGFTYPDYFPEPASGKGKNLLALKGAKEYYIG